MNLFDAAMLAPNISELIDSTSDGNHNQLDGLQGGVPFSEVTVSGKNLIKFPYADPRFIENGNTFTENGMTFTVNNDNSLTINGTAQYNTWFIFDNTLKMKPLTTYTLSGGLTEQVGEMVLYIHIYDINNKLIGHFAVDDEHELNGVTFTTAEGTVRGATAIQITEGYTFDNVVIFPQLEYGDVPTEYAPSIITQELTVTACGKNILRYPYTTADKTVCGVTYTDNGDGSITASGKHSGESVSTDYFSFSPWGEGVTNSAYKPLFVPKGQTVTWMVHGLPDNYRFAITVSDFDGSTIDVARSNDRTPITYITSKDCYIGCSIKPLKTAYGQDISFTCYPQLEYGSTATAYEPYSGANYTITPDSNPYIVPTDIYQQDGINNIYVSGEGEPTLSVTGVKENAAVKKIWDKLNELTTAIIVSNGEI